MNRVKPKGKLRNLLVFFFSLVTFHFSLILFSPAYGESGTSLENYLERLHRAGQTLQEAKSPEAWQEARQSVAAAFPEEEAVIFPDGKTRNLTFPLKPSEGAEKTSLPAASVDKERREALAVLSLYMRELESAYQVKPFTFAQRQKLKEQTEEILRSPEFSGYQETPWLQKLVARVIEWFQELLRKLFQALGMTGTGFLKYFIYGLMAVLVALILYFIFKNLIPLYASRSRKEKVKFESMAAEEDFRKENWRARALALAQQGNFREAVRACYLGLLQMLEQERLLRYNRSKTNWEYLAQLSSRPLLSAPMKELTLSFDYIWYGHQVMDARDYVKFYDGCEQVRETLKGEKGARGQGAE